MQRASVASHLLRVYMLLAFNKSVLFLKSSGRGGILVLMEEVCRFYPSYYPNEDFGA